MDEVEKSSLAQSVVLYLSLTQRAALMETTRAAELPACLLLSVVSWLRFYWPDKDELRP